MAKRTGLGRGIGALIPTADSAEARPVDVFFPGAPLATVPTPDAADATDAGGQADAAASTPDDTPGDLVAVPGARLISLDPNDIVPNPASRGPTSTPTTWPSSCTAFGSSGCCSRWSCA